MFAFVLLMCVALFGSGSTAGKLTKDNFMAVPIAYFKEFCGELLEKELLDALEVCAENNNQPELQKAITICIEASGKGATSYYDYLKAACEDQTIKPQYMECIEKFADDPEVLKQAAQHGATENCFVGIFNNMGFKMVGGISYKLVDEC